jgi:hypothetical protein
MKIEFAEELEAFRAEVADFCATASTPAIRKVDRKATSVFAPFEPCVEWHRSCRAEPDGDDDIINGSSN